MHMVCVFCQVIAGILPSTKAYEDEEVVVIKDIQPQANIHWLVMPKRHIDEYINADESVIHKLMDVVGRIIKQEQIKGYRIVSNGKGAALIDHLHIHVMGGIEKIRKL